MLDALNLFFGRIVPIFFGGSIARPGYGKQKAERARKSWIGNGQSLDSCGGDFDKGAAHATVFCLAKKEALVSGPVVIGLTERAAAVGHKSGVLKRTLGEAVKMSAKGRLQVVIDKHFEHILGVLRTHLDGFAEGKMGKGDEWLGLADFFGGFRQEANGRLVNAGLIGAQALCAVERNELPAFVLESVIEAIGKDLIIAAPIGLCHIVMISRDGIERNSKAAEDFLNRPEFLFVAVMREIASEKAEIGSWTRFDLLQYSFEERRAFLVNKVDVVNDGEMEIAGRRFALGAQCSRPKTDRKQGTGAEAQHFAAGNRMAVGRAGIHNVAVIESRWPIFKCGRFSFLKH